MGKLFYDREPEKDSERTLDKSITGLGKKIEDLDQKMQQQLR